MSTDGSGSRSSADKTGHFDSKPATTALRPTWAPTLVEGASRFVHARTHFVVELPKPVENADDAELRGMKLQLVLNGEVRAEAVPEEITLIARPVARADRRVKEAR